MSPNMFSVTTTSNERGAVTIRIAHESTSWCSSATSGNSAAISVATSRHSRDDSRTLALSTEVTRPLRPRASWNASRTTRAISVSVYSSVSTAWRRPSIVSRSRGRPKYSPPVSSRTNSTSTAASSAGWSGEVATSAGWTRTGRRLAYRPSCLRRPSRPCSGRCLARGSSHFGPPTAPSRIASARAHASSVAGGSGSPCWSSAAPPIGWDSNANWWPARAATAASTCWPSRTTSGPMPSPGNRTIVAFIAVSFRTVVDVARAARGGEPQAVLDAVDQRGERRLDDARRRADRGPLLAAVAVVDQHAGDGRRPVAPVEDADLVVVESDRRDLGVGAGQRLAERGVGRVDRAVAVGGGVVQLAADHELDRGLGERLAAVALAEQDLVVDQLERGPVRGVLAPQHERDRGLGGLERAAGLLALLEPRQHRAGDAGDQGDVELLGLGQHVAAPGQLADHDAGPVADQDRIDVLVRSRRPADRRDV